jgi:glucose/arabinose dehydrogenase
MRRSLRPFLLLWLLLGGCNSQVDTPFIIPSPTTLESTHIASTATTTPAELLQPTEVKQQPQVTSTTAFQQSALPTLQTSVTRFPDPSSYDWQPVAGGFRFPLYLTSAVDGSGRIFVMTQPGQIWIIRDGLIFEQPFLDISEEVTATSGSGGYGERGLLGLAFHPDYLLNGYFYVDYTDREGNTIIARYRVSPDPDRADPLSEQKLLLVNQPYPNHNGGMLAFGPDGYLYIALGDGGSAGDPEGNAQSLDTLLGKILRIDVNGGEPYTIPASNPYAYGGGAPEIRLYGLRNPWRFSFDAITGDLFIGDVGQNQWEEVDYLPAGDGAGDNFGWDFREGLHAYEGEPLPDSVLVDPVFE